MNSYPKISIVTPSYNQGEFIEETILSVLNQGYPNLEYIVIDGGSTDNTLAILEKYKDSLAYWVSEKDGGQGNAINKGFRKATGDIYGWINSDDYYLPHTFEALAKAYSPASYQFYYGDSLDLDENKVLSYTDANYVIDDFLRFGGLIASHSAFWDSRIHQEIWEEMKCNVDGELWIRMLKGTRKKYIRQPLGVYRHHDEAKSHDEKWKTAWREDGIRIEQRYGPPPQARSYLRIKYLVYDKIFSLIRKIWRRPQPWR